MRWSKALCLFSFFFAFVGLKAQNYSLSGFVKDSTSGESIKGAVVKNLSNGASVTTNNYGFFSLTLPSGEQSVRISAGEYEGVTLVRDVQSDEQISIYLLPRADAIDEVRIRAKRNDNVRAVDISTQSITGKVIKKIPAFLG